MKSKVLRIKLFYILLIIILAAAGGIMFRIRMVPSPQERTTHEFFNDIMEQKNYDEYLSADLKDHPFPAFVKQEGISQIRVEGMESISRNQRRVWISALFPAGRIPFYLDMVKYDGRWMIIRLPEVMQQTHGIPVKEMDKEKDQSRWMIALGSVSVELTVPSSADIKAGQPVSFTALDDMLASIQPLQPVKLTKVLSLTQTTLEDEQLGYFNIEGPFPVFLKEKDEYSFSGSYYLPIGTTEALLYSTEDQTGRMAVMTQPFDNYELIRVILRDSGYTSLLHSHLEITCADGFTVSSPPSGIHLSFDEGDIVEFKPSEAGTEVRRNGELLSSSNFRWHIQSKGQAPLYVKNIHRSQAHPGSGTPYGGKLEVTMTDGSLVLINEVALEKYLYTVVPSEMPIKFGLEALKVQAVAARSYAARAIRSTRYREYGAHLDDSTASQVYNNISEQDVAVHAVNETAGIVAVYNDEIVDTRFFSSSCGYTANHHEVWSNSRNEFPGDEIPYLIAQPQYSGKIPDLYREENFRAFLNQDVPDGYDRFSPYFRWTVRMSRRQLEAVISSNLASLYQQQPLFVLTKTAEETYESRDIPEQTDMGTLLNIEVLRRGEGGNMMDLEITTTHGTFRIIKEYNIRRILQPVDYLNGSPVILHCHDGTSRENFPLLPSAFAYIDFERDSEGNIQEVTIRGGGYGHGVGMSQYGSYGLTLMGKTWQDIIKHYYPGSELYNLSD
ncbi:MAG: SpoIID/LytB domain-containing protein [Caldicoprobacterales bacterium]|jgi:stage II sporulation protein D